MMRKIFITLSLLLALLLGCLAGTELWAASPAKKPTLRKKLNLTPSYSLLSNGATPSPEFASPSDSGTEGSEEGSAPENGWGLVPFVGSDRATTPPPLPERPAITASDPLTTPPGQIVAGFTYRQGNRFFLNFGYAIPTAPLREYAQPFGFTLSDEEPDAKRVTIGIDIAF